MFITLKNKNYDIKKINKNSFKDLDMNQIDLFMDIALNNCNDKIKLLIIKDYLKAIDIGFNNDLGFNSFNIELNLKKCLTMFLLRHLNIVKDITINNTNEKVGSNTMTIDFNNWCNCTNRLNGNCNCSKKCYDLKAVSYHTMAVVFNTLKNHYFLLKEPQALFKRFIHLIKNTKKGNSLKYLRFNSRGDFNSKKQLKFVLELSKALKGFINCYTYTKSYDLVNSYYLNHKNDFKNIVFNSSIEGALLLPSNTYLITTNPNKVTCNCICTECNKCKVLTKKTTYVLLH